MRLYLDASAIIYSIEGVPEFREAALRWIEAAEAAETGALITSRLSRLECRVRPLREGNAERLAHYEGFFSRADLLLVDVSAAVLEHATELRARYSVRSPDAIHLASALSERADVFVTGDRQLRRCAEIKVELVNEPPVH
jgi:predicted nucleic acid-binding protein